MHAVVAFTGHNVIAADVDPEKILSRIDPEGLSSPLEPEFLVWMGKQLGSKPGMLAAVLAATGVSPSRELPRLEMIERPPPNLESARTQRAFRYREEVSVYADVERRALVTLGRGLARRWEVGIEVDPSHRNEGLGNALLLAARTLVDEGEPIFAQIPPGNAASVRAFLKAGFQPIGSEVPFLKVSR